MKKLNICLLMGALITLSALSGCGQLGPLYLPDDAKKTHDK